MVILFRDLGLILFHIYSEGLVVRKKISDHDDYCTIEFMRFWRETARLCLRVCANHFSKSFPSTPTCVQQQYIIATRWFIFSLFYLRKTPVSRNYLKKTFSYRILRIFNANSYACLNALAEVASYHVFSLRCSCHSLMSSFSWR